MMMMSNFILKLLCVIISSCLIITVLSFPESDDPLAVEPPIPVIVTTNNYHNNISTKSCSVKLFDEALCSSWGLVLKANYTPPADCPGPYEQVVFHMTV